MNIKTISGEYQVPDDTHLGRWQLESDRLDHDQHLVPLACEHIKAGMVVLDGGSFNGDHSCAYRRAAGHQGVVISIEANPFTFSMLKHNMKLQTDNGPYGAFTLAESICLNVALGRNIGYIVATMAENENLGASYLERNVFNPNSPSMPVISIDFISQVFDVKFGFVKLDIEGFEYEALLGASNVLKTQKPTLMIEMCASNLARQEANYTQIYELLTIHGYKWEILQPQCTPESEQYDILATVK